MLTPERGERDLEEYVRAAFDDMKAGLWTSAPGIVKSYNAEKQTVSVQLSVKSSQRMPDGSVKQVSVPVLQDVPVQFPGGGGHSMTFPVKPGDECLVNFSCRNPDAWQQSGGEQAPVDAATHSLSHGFAMLGFRSNPEAKKRTGGGDADAVTIRSDDGQTVISLKGGTITQTVGGCSMTHSADGWDFTGGHIKHNGKSIDADHIHGGVLAGGANTSTPSN